MKDIYKSIVDLAKINGAARLVLFGSRARKDNRENSDIDIAVYGMSKEKQSVFWSSVDDLPTLVDFDIVHITSKTDCKLLANIERDGVVLMDKFTEKYDKFVSAVSRLNEAINEYDKAQLDVIRDGAIQRFEFCTELAWKTIREKLIDEGFVELNSPKAVMRQAFASGIIKDEQSWIELLNDRNLTSHIYDEDTVNQIFSNICNLYVRMFSEIINQLR